MKIRREEKGEVLFAQLPRGFRRRQIDFYSERLQDIRAAGLRGDGAVAVLGHGHAGGGAQDGGGRGNVERAQPVAARADDVEDLARVAPVLFNRRRHGFLAQRGGERGDFLRRLALLRQRDEKIRLGRRGDFLVRQAFDGGADLRGGQGLPAGELVGERFEHAPFYGGARKEETEIAAAADFVVTCGLQNRSAKSDLVIILWQKNQTAAGGNGF